MLRRLFSFSNASDRKEHITQVILTDLKKTHHNIRLSYQDQIKIKTFINMYLSAVEQLGPIIALYVLAEIDKSEINYAVKNNPAVYHWAMKIRDYIDSIKYSLKLSGSDYNIKKYINYLIHSKIIQISRASDIIGMIFNNNHKNVITIIKFMNIITTSIRYLNKDSYYFREFYHAEHVSILTYLLSEKRLTLLQAVSEIRQLDLIRVNCLKDLFDDGLRGEDLRQFKENIDISIYFSEEHHNVLKYLIHNQHLSPKSAMHEIIGLCSDRVVALKESWSLGLRGEHLRKWKKGDYASFCETKGKTIKYLIYEHKLEPEKAVLEVDQLPYECCEALQALYYLGLRGEHFRQRNLMDTFSRYTDSLATKALISLTRDQEVCLPVEKALDEIDKLRDHGCYIIALGELYHLGLRSEHLLSYKTAYRNTDENNFTRDHFEALKVLIKKHHLSPKAAINEITGLSSDAASAVKEFYRNGLEGSDLRGWDYNGQFGFEHYQTFESFIKENGMSVANALEKLKQMSSYEVHIYEENHRQMKSHRNCSYLPGLYGPPPVKRQKHEEQSQAEVDKHVSYRAKL